MVELDCLEGLPLEELVISGKLLCVRYKDKTAYIRWVASEMMVE
jgi:hypothetical protein